MCGRFFLTAKLDEILEAVNAKETAFERNEYHPRFNIAPTQDAVVASVGHDGERVLGMMRWNLRPSFWKPGKPELSLINLRSENAFEKPVWKRLLARHRVAVPMSGFYEWKALGTGKDARKQPLRIEESDEGGVSFFAGVWDRWESEDGKEKRLSFSILTQPANASLEGVHDRMPVLLTPKSIDTWLDRGVEDLSILEKVVHASLSAKFHCVPVSTRVNSPRNDDASLLLPA